VSPRVFGSLTWSVPARGLLCVTIAELTFCHFLGRQQEPEDLFETISQVLLNALDRDALSGNGAVVHVMCVYRLLPSPYVGRMDADTPLHTFPPLPSPFAAPRRM
jgi:hypothetical protein